MNALHALKRRKRAERIARVVTPFLSVGDQVLDFGCGDMLIAEKITLLQSVDIFGVDVPNTSVPPRLSTIYRGSIIPFRSKSFDVTMCSFVLHHIDDNERSLSECIRVTRKRLIVLEDVYTNAAELMALKSLDTMGRLSYWSINLPYNFRTEAGWIEQFRSLQLRLVALQSIRPEFWRPARHRMFVLDLI
jgi:ubiquinone/menaquinone biosynthesis C-methylase UbiE